MPCIQLLCATENDFVIVITKWVIWNEKNATHVKNECIGNLPLNISLFV